MLHKWIEAPVATEQHVLVLDAPGGDHGVDRLAGRYATFAQGPVVLRRPQRNFPPAQLHDEEGSQQFLRGAVFPFVREARKDFRQDAAGDGAVESVDPDAGFDQHHPSILIA
jgi:hypothetical protein